MADSSLDDFFKRKDKNKKSKKKNITTTEDIAKRLEESGKRIEKQRKNKEKTNALNSNANSNANILEQEDEEWNDFEEEREKDYTGLRIQTLTIKDKEEELREQMQENEEESKKESQTGPWKVFVPPVVDEPEDKATDDDNSANTPQTNAPQTGGKYVPPAMRMSGLSSQPLSSTRKSKFGAPKIGDANEFPTLGAPDTSEDSKGFQPVRAGYGGRDSSERSSNITVTSNKYGVLNNRSTERLNDNNSQ